MPSDKYLIIGASPFHNEEGVLSTKVISIEFSKNMDSSTLHDGTVFLQEVNGLKVDCDYEYVNLKKTLNLKPKSPLKNYTQYAIVVIGGENGPLSILEDYPYATRKFEFTTKQEVIFPSLSVTLSSENTYLFANFQASDIFDGSVEYKVSASNESEQDGLYPETGTLFSKIGKVDIPVSFKEGIYYVHARLKKEDLVSDWVRQQHYVEAKEESTCPSPPPVIPVFNLFLEKSYPEDGANYADTDKIGLIFSEEIDSVRCKEEGWIRLKKKKVRFFDQEEIMELAIEGLDDLNESTLSSKVLLLTPTLALGNGQSYELVLSKNIESATDSALSLGVTKTISFKTKNEFVYIKPENVLSILGELGEILGEKEIIEAIERVSKEVYEKLVKQGSDLATELANGTVPYPVYLYVLYKVSKILLTRIMIRQGKGSGQTITLSDLTVQKKEWDKSMYDSLLDELEEELKKAEDELFAKVRAKMTGTVKGESGAVYPDFMSRTEYKELGS